MWGITACLLNTNVTLWSSYELVCQDRSISNLRYADDTTRMAESEEELKSLFMKDERGVQKRWLKNSTFEKLRSWHPVPSLHGK